MNKQPTFRKLITMLELYDHKVATEIKGPDIDFSYVIKHTKEIEKQLLQTKEMLLTKRNDNKFLYDITGELLNAFKSLEKEIKELRDKVEKSYDLQEDVNPGTMFNMYEPGQYITEMRMIMLLLNLTKSDYLCGPWGNIERDEVMSSKLSTKEYAKIFESKINSFL